MRTAVVAEDVLGRAAEVFVDAVLAGREAEAVAAFTQAQVVDLAGAREELLGWVGRAGVALEGLPDCQSEPAGWQW